MFYLHFLGNLCLLVKNVLKDGLFVIHVSIWPGDQTQKHNRRCSVTWQMLVADCFSTALLCEEPTLWQDPDRAEETDSSSRSLWSHLYPVECSVSHNQTQLCRERKKNHGEQCNSTLLQQLTFSRKHLTSNDWVTGTFNMSEIWRKYNTVWFLHDTLNLSYRFQNKYGLY